MHPIRHKFNAKRCEADNIKFPSKKEKAYYLKLKERQKSGEILFFLRQVPLHLEGGIRYVVDFLEFHSDQTVHFVDVKGYKTSVYVMKRKQAMDRYPIEIEEK